MIEKGLCQCGCGKKTWISTVTNRNKGYIKEVPVDYLLGHKSKGNNHPRWRGGLPIESEGYKLIYNRNHPKSRNGRIREHILVCEKALGRPVPEGKVTHHFPDKTKFTHLVLCENDAYHILLHLRYRALKESGHKDWRRCCGCKKWDDPKNLILEKSGTAYYHLECRRTYQRNWNRKYRLFWL